MKNYFIENQLETKHGNFIVRVYKETQGKETIVLYTKKLDTKKPVLTRIHSECFTGDVFQSLRCDCGEQLKKSIEKINKNNGVLIYLRQEGRGIGLFEKIKTYQLQDKGHDTFNANIILGYNPDERQYEKAKIALKDLKINNIDLLTNNPSKILGIKKLGISVNKRIPLIIETNKHNKKYFETKKKKFKHFL